MINTYIPYFKAKDRVTLNKCLKSNFVSTAGPLVNKFEQTFSSKYKFKYSVALNSGTSALHLGLKALGVKEGDTVILPSYTFAATANAILYNNANPWFFDCDKDFNLPLETIEKILKKETHKKSGRLILKKNGSIVRAIIPVSTFGKKLDFDNLLGFSKKHNLKILFDTAACHDPKIFNFIKKKEMNFCFSFNGNKTLTTGAGGMFSSNSKSISSKVRMLANVGKKSKKYDYETVGFNYKMTNVQASLGISQLNNIKNILNIKRKIFNNYNKYFYNLKDIKLITNQNYINWVFAVMVKSYKEFKKLQNAFIKSGIQMDLFWKPLHLQKPYTKFKKSNLNNTHSIWKKVVVLPSHPGLVVRQQKKIIKNVLKICK